MPIVELCSGGRKGQADVPANTLLADIINDGGHQMDLPCAGAGTCLKCRVYAWGMLTPPTAAERAHLGKAGLADGARLACQAAVLGKARVEWKPAGTIHQMFAGGNAKHAALAPYYSRAGLAVDIGTTTLAATLFTADAAPDQAGETFAVQNPQTRFGADVMSRIQLALQGNGETLAKAVRDGVTQLVDILEARRGLARQDIDAMVLTGNTTMLTLLVGANPAPLARAPFVAERLFGQELPAGELFPNAGFSAKAYLPRCISAFVGADITTALLSTGLCAQADTALLADIGTNGEIVLWHEGKLTCCSTAAGPALEGAGVENGSSAVVGAIDKVWNGGGSLRYSTLGGGAARGLCGSGILDTLALMLREGIVDETGAFRATGHAFEARIERESGKSALRIADGVIFTAEDVRKVQLAKAAIRAGMETLLAAAGVRAENVRRFYVAGGFGNYLSMESAAAVGLFPKALAGNVRIAGNAALNGASQLLHNTGAFGLADALAADAATTDLIASPIFRQQYMEQMAFEAD